MLDQILAFLKMALDSHMGMMFAAAVLSALVWVLQKCPVVDKYVAANSVLQKISMVVLAVVPAVIVKLNSASSWSDVLSTAVMAFLGALGVHSLLPAAKSESA